MTPDFMTAVDCRSEATLLPIIQQWIEHGTLIISDCWKSYVNLEKHGYKHATVNHSVEFVNKDGQHTNKVEGLWRLAKAALPTFGVTQGQHSSHLAEFIWRNIHKENDLFQCFLDDVKKIYEVDD